MPYTTAQQALIDWVESRIDEITPVGQTPTVSHNTIYNELKASTNNILLRARPQLVYEAMVDGAASATASEDDSFIIQLPVDFLRFMKLRLDSWDHPLYEAIAPDTNEYRQQFNQYQGASAGRPVAALIPRIAGTSKRALQCFPTGALQEFIYVPKTLPEDAPDVLQDAIVWEAAGRALQATKMAEFTSAYQAAEASLQRLNFGVTGERSGQEVE